jgi:hypothetical protein
MDSDKNHNNLKKTFIAMLFALVIATLAESTSDILYVVTNGWEDATNFNTIVLNLRENNWLIASSISHSILSLLMVSMSWVIWSRSLAAGHKKEISQFVSPTYIILLIEVFLVILYFSLVKNIEGDISGYKTSGDIDKFIIKSSAIPEASIMMWIFITFTLWDFFADVIDSPTNHKESSYLMKIASLFQGFLTYCSISAICAFLCYLVLIYYETNSEPIKTIYADISLILALFIFWSAKPLERLMIDYFPNEDLRDNTSRGEPGKSEWVKLLLSVILYLIFLGKI